MSFYSVKLKYVYLARFHCLFDSEHGEHSSILRQQQQQQRDEKVVSNGEFNKNSSQIFL